jgi:hypothetical protein
MTNQIADITLSDAFARLALELTEMRKTVDPMTGQETEENANSFIVRKMLNGICYSTEVTLGYSQKSLDKAAYSLRRAMDQYDREVSSHNLEGIEKAQGWCERIVAQQAVLTNFFNEARTAYEVHTGETYVDAAAQQAAKKYAQARIDSNPNLESARKLLEAIAPKQKAA